MALLLSKYLLERHEQRVTKSGALVTVIPTKTHTVQVFTINIKQKYIKYYYINT